MFHLIFLSFPFPRGGRLFTLWITYRMAWNATAAPFTWTLLTSLTRFSSEIPLCRGRPFARGYNRDITHCRQAYNIYAHDLRKLLSQKQTFVQKRRKFYAEITSCFYVELACFWEQKGLKQLRPHNSHLYADDKDFNSRFKGKLSVHFVVLHVEKLYILNNKARSTLDNFLKFHRGFFKQYSGCVTLFTDFRR